MSNMGYWIDLNGITFDDGQDGTWLQALPLGSYKHPLYGKINVTPDRVNRFATNVKSQVRGQELDIDYDHKEYSGKAAGWVKDAEARSDGLWLKVQWTEDAQSSIQKKEYRYFSPELADKWTHPKTGVAHQDVLFGGALTNRPFLKDILPINMSELSDGGDNEVEKFLEELRKALKLSEDATEEDILQAAQDVVSSEGEEGEEESEEEEGEEGETNSTPEELAELENHPVIKKMLRNQERLLSENATLRGTMKLNEINIKLGEWSSVNPSEGAKYALPPAVHDDLRTIMLSENSKSLKATSQFVEHILEHGLVELGERGGDPSSPSRNGHGGSATKQFTDEIERRRKEDKDLDYVTAANMVMNEIPSLYTAYRDEVLTDTTDLEA